MLDYKSCSIFIKIAEIRNITKAACELGYTQAGLSLMVKKMEEECGFLLLQRGKTGVSPTHEALELMPVMRDIVNSHERFDQISAAIKGVSIGTVRLGCFSSIAYHWIPKIIKKFRVSYPGINVSIMEGGTVEIERWIEEKSVDIGFLTARPGQKFKTVTLCRDSIMAVLPKNHPMADADHFPLSAFGGAPLIIPGYGYDVDVYKIAQAYRKKIGVMPEIKFSSTDEYAIISMVENELGLSALPALLLKGHSANVVVKRITPNFPRTMIMGVRSMDELSPAAAKFAEYSRREISEEAAAEGLA